MKTLLALACAATLAACAGHHDRMEGALSALDAGNGPRAIAAINEEIEVERAEDLPPLEGDNALFLLERATILMSEGDHKLSKRDYEVADKATEVLDLERGTADDIGKYLFSDDVGPYKAPPYEKLLINSLNLMNYLALHDLQGAKVEARRLAVMQAFVKDTEEASPFLGIGSYVAGFAFEKAGEPEEAKRYYEDALAQHSFASLREVIEKFGIVQPGAEPVLDEGAEDAFPAPAGPPIDDGSAELCIVTGVGRVPPKIANRIPIGLALTLVAGSIHPHQAAKANALAAKGLVTWINFPTLGKAKGAYAEPRVALDGTPVSLEEALDVEREVRAEWKRNEGKVILAAITRMIARLVAGEVTQAAVSAAGGRNGNILGLLAGLATTGALAATDTPDTRSWSTLPARLSVARLRLPPGKHRLTLSARGEAKTVELDLPPGGWAFVPFFSLR